MKQKIAISTSSFGKYDSEPLKECERQGYEVVMNPHGRKVTPDELIGFANEAIGLIAGTEKLSKDVIEKLPRLKVISRCGSGMDSVDLVAAKNQGVEVLNTPDGPTAAVSELTVGLILNLLRKINQIDSFIKKGKWEKVMGNLLSGKKVGVIGFGRIGQKVAQLLSPFGAELAYSDPNLKDGILSLKNLSIEELLAWADIVSLHVSGSREILGKREIARMKKGSWLVNVSRGGTIDEDALSEALANGRICGAAIDVFKQEPYEGPLKQAKNTILTSHIGSYAKEARIRMEVQAVTNLIKALNK